MSQKSYDNTPSLFLIPTPIGNMEDMTYRAVKTLSEVELVLSEDTRVTGLLMKHFDIKKLKSNYWLLFAAAALFASDIAYYTSIGMVDSKLSIISILKKFSVVISTILPFASTFLIHSNILA